MTQTEDSLGARIRALVIEAQSNIKKVAAKAGIHRTRLSKIINARETARPEEIVWIAGALRVPVERLTGGLEVAFAADRNVKARAAETVTFTAAEHDQRVKAAKAMERDRDNWRAQAEATAGGLAFAQRQFAAAVQRLEAEALAERDAHERGMALLTEQNDKLVSDAKNSEFWRGVYESFATSMSDRIEELEKGVALWQRLAAAAGALGAAGGYAAGRRR